MPRLIDMDYRPAAGPDALVMTLGSKRLRLHPYFYAIDGEGEEPAVVRHSLSALLSQWRQAIADAKTGDTVFLPYDFEDESIRWLRCRFTHEGCSLQAGWSPQEGARVKPSQWTPEKGNVLEFERLKHVPTAHGQRGQLLKDVDNIQSRLRTDRK
jgi:hypothetical protein